MALYTEETFTDNFNFVELEQTVASTIRLATQNPTSLYLFFQRYIYFNGYASAVIARLASSIAMSRYLFTDPDVLTFEEADRGFQISAEVMIAASDEGSHEITHRELAQLLLQTLGNYAGFSSDERNQFAKAPSWMNEIVRDVMAGYQGTPNDVASLIKSVGFHAASEMLGDREYALLDMIIRYENKGFGFDRYLKDHTSAVRIRNHRYDPWCYIVIHGKHDGSGAEARHFVHVLNALNMINSYRIESPEQIQEWVFEGYKSFVELQQRVFREIYRECLLLQSEKTSELVATAAYQPV
ncbi:MAG: hypothetical protein ACRC2R_09045 [Xenococcaceae cyanobacterium]